MDGMACRRKGEVRGRVWQHHLHALALPPLPSCPTRLYLPGPFRTFLLRRHLPTLAVRTEEGCSFASPAMGHIAVRPSRPLIRPPGNLSVQRVFTKPQHNFGYMAATRDGDSVIDMQTAHDLG